MEDIKMIDGLPVYRGYINDLNDGDLGLERISFVDSPATEVEMMLFSKTSIKSKFEIENDDKRLIVAPVMIANKPILREDMFGQYYYITFSPEDLEKLKIKYSKDNKVNNYNEDHISNKMVSGVYMVESWQTNNENDRAYTELGFNVEDAPIGSWFQTAYVEDEDYWNNVIKSGKFKGLSLEAFYFEEPMFIQNEEEQAVDIFQKRIDACKNEEELIDLIDEFIKTDKQK